MISRRLLENHGLNKREFINLLVQILPDFTLEELDEVYLNIALEIEYREDHDEIDEEDSE